MHGKRVAAAPRAPHKVYNRLHNEVSSELTKETSVEAKTKDITRLISTEYELYKGYGKKEFISNICIDYCFNDMQISVVKKKFDNAGDQFRKSVSGESSLSLLVKFIIQNSETTQVPRDHASITFSAAMSAARSTTIDNGSSKEGAITPIPDQLGGSANGGRADEVRAPSSYFLPVNTIELLRSAMELRDGVRPLSKPEVPGL